MNRAIPDPTTHAGARSKTFWLPRNATSTSVLMTTNRPAPMIRMRLLDVGQVVEPRIQ